MHDEQFSLGKDIHVAQWRYDYTVAAIQALKHNDIVLPDRLRAAAIKRQADYLAGRYCARQALRNAGLETPPPLSLGEHGAPVWPSGFVGSITHCNGWAVAAAARGAYIRAIGIDMEESVPVDVAEVIRDQIVGEAESYRLERLALPSEIAFTIAFSAKESLFKALYPTVRRYFDFRDAEAVAIDLDNGSLDLRINTTLSSQYTRGSTYRVRFSCHGSRVLTCCLP